MAGTYTESAKKSIKKYQENHKEEIAKYQAEREKTFGAYKIRMSIEEKQKLNELAKESGKTINQFIIDKIFDRD